MIGPVILKGELIEQFSKHLLSFPYHLVIHEGTEDVDNSCRIFSKDEVADIMEIFNTSSYPIVCKSGSKSSIPFWGSHAALKYGRDKKEVVICKLLARDPKQDNMIKGILMSYYFLVNNRFGVDKLLVPLDLQNLIADKSIHTVYNAATNITYLSRK
jgi:hypothetical protein